MRYSSSRVDDQPVRTIAPAVKLSVWAVAGGWIARKLCRLIVLIVTTPAALATFALAVGVAWIWHRFGPWPIIIALALTLAGLVVWRVRWPAGFLGWVRFPLRAWRRSWFVYRRRWVPAMDTAGLTLTRAGDEYVPSIIGVRSTLAVDRVGVRMLPGQTIEDYAAAAPRLAQTFGAPVCRVRSISGRVHELDLWLLVDDPLTRTVDPIPAAAEPLVDGLPVALAEDGTVWSLPLVGSHTLVVGATGAGKGSVIWSIICQLADPVRTGVVKLWVIDPKGGMELAAGRPLFDRFCHGDSTSAAYETAFADLLDDAVLIMRRRQDRLRGVTRLHTPSTDEPLIVLVVDELAALTGWTLDRTAKKRMEAALGLLLSQGRAVGVVVVGAVQDPRKEVLPMRDLFPTRIALRLNEPEQVNLTIGAGARNRGALADQIPDSLPGVGYVAVDGIAEPVRVRFSHITDQHIDELLTPNRLTLELVTETDRSGETDTEPGVAA